MKRSDEIRFGLIGCGRIAPKHAEAIKALDGATLAGVVDIVPERAEAFAQKYGAPAFTDYRQMFELADVDVVNICAPSGLHAEMGIAAAQAGKHVVVEKPMALSLGDADRLIEACREAGVKLFVVHQNRYNAVVKRLRHALDTGRFGKLSHANATVRWSRDQSYYDSGNWRGTWAMDGGVLMNQCIHNIDLLQWMMGPVDSLHAYTATRFRRIQAEDIGVAVLRFKNGALGVIEGTSNIYPKNLEETLSIFGESGTAVLGGIAVNKIEAWRFGDQMDTEEAVLAEQQNDPPTVYGFGHQEYMSDVIRSIREDLPPFIGGEEGRKALEIVLAVYRSVSTGAPVKFPLVESWDSLEQMMAEGAAAKDE